MDFPRLEIRNSESEDQPFYFVLRSQNNGEVILTSEMYTTKSDCENGIESVKNNASDIENYERKTSKNGEPYFVLKAANGEIIGRSEMYSSEVNRDNGIKAVQRDGAQVETELAV
ncbi:MAG: YegP family protein [Balneolaceae bacterium]|nr:YegP family protein [Balneolaceae bacterium]